MTDTYLIENYQITHLTSGRDLLRFPSFEVSQQPPVVIANPNYNNANPSTAAVTAPEPNDSRAIDASNISFSTLPGTAEEAQAIAPLLPNPTLLLEENATENAIKQVHQPSILHIATHGFFLQDLPQSPPDLELTSSFNELPPAASLQENPLERSGLAFAGANQRQSGQRNGILTAMEASGLDLRGTQLVVLSACDTGVGQVATGEGVYGLRRSLTIAGAESQSMSLWQVEDNSTKDLMIAYYQNLRAGQGRSEALRQAQLAMINSKDNDYRPYHWAAFINSGNWTPLDMP